MDMKCQRLLSLGDSLLLGLCSQLKKETFSGQIKRHAGRRLVGGHKRFFLNSTIYFLFIYLFSGYDFSLPEEQFYPLN